MPAAPGKPWRRRALAVAFGWFFVVLLWGVAELVLAPINAHRRLLAGTSEHVPLDGGGTLPRIDPLEAAGPVKALRMRTVKRNPSGVVFDVVYTILSPGYRYTPVDHPEDFRNRAVVFLGCSYTIGDGVQDGETLAAATARIVSWAKPYNFGFPGWGTHKVRSLLEGKAIDSTVQERARPIAVYTFFDQHVRRTIGSLRNYTAVGPRYELEGGKPVVTGSFPEARGWLFPLLARSEVLSFFKIDFPVRVSSGDLDLTAALIESSRDKFIEKYPDGRFVVLFYPGSEYAAPLEQRLAKSPVEIVDATALFDPAEPGLHIEGDGHPSPEAYRRVAAALAPFLEK